MAETKLTLRDQLLINAMMYLACSVRRDPNHDMIVHLVCETLPNVNIYHHRLRPLVAAAELVAASVELKDPQRMKLAIFDARRAMADIALWRASLVQDELKKPEKETT